MYSVISFDEGREIIDKGEAEAKKILDTLKKLGGDPIHRKKNTT